MAKALAHQADAASVSAPATPGLVALPIGWPGLGDHGLDEGAPFSRASSAMTAQTMPTMCRSRPSVTCPTRRG